MATHAKAIGMFRVVQSPSALRFVAPAARAMPVSRWPDASNSRCTDSAAYRPARSASATISSRALLPSGCFYRRAAQLPREAAAARVRPGAEAPKPNITSAASRRLQFGCSKIAATGAPLFAHPLGTGRAAYGGR